MKTQQLTFLRQPLHGTLLLTTSLIAAYSCTINSIHMQCITYLHKYANHALNICTCVETHFHTRTVDCKILQCQFYYLTPSLWKISYITYLIRQIIGSSYYSVRYAHLIQAHLTLLPVIQFQEEQRYICSDTRIYIYISGPQPENSAGGFF